MAEHVDMFLAALDARIRDNTFVKLTLGSHRGRDSSLRKILIRPVALASGDHLCFVYRYATKDVTKNLPIEEGQLCVRKLLGSDFLTANLFATTEDIELICTNDLPARLRHRKPTHSGGVSRDHNRLKKRSIASQGTPYLALLGVTKSDGSIKKGMEPKYRQINKFIEIIDPLIRSSPLRHADAISVMDMGSGKGYLTFALYDYLANTLKKRASVTGVEVRKELVDFCNSVAHAVGFGQLRFECGNIHEVAPRPTDMLIALHACNTATDEALFKAIKARAALVLCAPCCHQELRPQLRCQLSGLAKILQSGILLERQAELLTDGMRALLLEAFGYKATIFEFISTEHTSKNIMIAGVKTKKTSNRATTLQEIDSLKKAFGIETQYLEKLLEASQ